MNLSYLLNIKGKRIRQIREAKLTNNEQPIALTHRPINETREKLSVTTKDTHSIKMCPICRVPLRSNFHIWEQSWRLRAESS